MSSDPATRDSDRPGDDELADIVAYLDGELDEPAAELMERRLIREDPLRQYADSLDQTWHLLDSLEEVTASGDFASRTLSSLTAIEAEPTPESIRPAARAGSFLRRIGAPQLVGWTVFGFLIASIGVLTGRSVSQRRHDPTDVEILTNLPVLRSYHHYRVVPDADFLRELSLPPAGTSTEDSAGGTP